MATSPPPSTFAADAAAAAEGAVDAASDAAIDDEVHHNLQQKQKQRQQQQQLERNSLLADLRRSTNFWFRAKSTDGLQLLAQSCTRILQHGLLQPVELQRLSDDFEFLLASAGNQQHPQAKPAQPCHRGSSGGSASVVAGGVEQFLGEWTTRCLGARCLSQCLQTLVSDPELMELYYPSAEAFLRRSSDATALFVCLTAVQLNQSGLLGQLEVKHQLRHRRTCSQPNFSISPKLQAVPEERLQKRSFIRRLKSLPNLSAEDEELEERTSSRRRCQTFSSSSRRQHYLETAPSSSSCSSQDSPKRIQLINCDDIKIWTDQTPQEQLPQEMQDKQDKKVPPAAPRASVGSYLGSFFGSPPLYTSWFQRSLGEDHLNATGDGGMLDTFLPVNGRKLKNRQPTLFEGVSMLDEAAAASSTGSCLSSAPWDIQGSSTTSTTASSSVSITPGSSDKMDQQSLASFLQMSRQTHNNTQLEKENAHFRISEACITAIEHVKWSRRLARPPVGPAASTNPSEPNLMPYVEQIPGGGGGGVQNHSAEAVGLQLISRFSEQQLPRLGHLKWLVSEQEAPQQLLPMPKQQDQEQASLTRGTSSWAPPRQQIIFTEHPANSRGKLLQQQNHRCAGCGMRVAKHLQQHFRYCSYLGKYLCTGCHRNQISAIPARILRSWDFRCYPVCSFAYRLIEQMYAFPLFHVPDLNGQLYKHKELAKARRKRLQLHAVKGFIANCRFATREQSFFNAIPVHITQDPDMWSMCDFVDVQNSSMNRSIKEVIALSEQHVHNCVLCTGRAFLCEHCKGGELIYPWQRKVQRCDRCGACFHHACWKIRSRCRSQADPCPRCSRLQNRAS
ncbi:uncharacterized protein LOC128260266 [Drosophila gunungcola]|uniref:Rubicon Homology domain-containing protein n=1 Tax=Drosophila gunungcola TaxID=103775 RepID=A0A9Q0BKT8_9MUSC|nr:uncharacterized protein LOC128260266 [Drosophila gunungcola]KAI8036167.1 hypothetical protein M5D96_011027 [Drosophila gunungcola]